MKLNKFYLLGVAALGLVACNKDNNNDPEVTGNTYANLRISLVKSDAAPRIIDSQADENGRDAEGKVATIDVFSTGGDKAFSTLNTDFFQNAPDPVYYVKAWVASPGNQTMALMLNRNGLNGFTIGQAVDYIYGTGVAADIDKMIVEDAFMMTSKVEAKSIQPGISQTTADANPGTINEAHNQFGFDVERVVSQGMVVKAATLKTTTEDNLGDIETTSLKYAAVNGAAKTYVFANYAGKRQMTDDINKNNEYEGYKSAIDAEFPTFADAKLPSAVTGKLIRLGNLGALSAQGKYAAKDIEDLAAAKTKPGIYFFENSVNQSSLTSDNKRDGGFYRLAYAKVYVKFQPKTVYFWDGTTMKALTYTELLTKNATGTFYKGEQDGVLYADKASAKKSTIAPDQAAFTYKDGKCAYRALWNRQENTALKSVVNANTRRNNIYVLEVAGFKTLGMPWDSSDPQDPNLPKPNDPDEPNPGNGPDDPNIEKQDTYMRVQAKILPWNKVSRNNIILD